MKKNLKISDSIVINASAEKVWDVLTNPDKRKIYLFGAETITDWKVGSPIISQGVFNGQKYQDKGTVLENNYGKLLKYSRWNSLEGYADIPENYSILTYSLERLGGGKTKLDWKQEQIPTEEEQKNSKNFLPGILEQIKRLAEQE